MILAPLRGVTVRCFRRTFAADIAAAGFDEAFTPFIAATPGFDPLRDRELRRDGLSDEPVKITPQFIGKDPAALRRCLERVKAAGFDTADLNAGCPFPMVRNKGRGSGLLRTPDVLRQMLEVGCEVMGNGRFSVKTRLGVEGPDELLGLMPMINCFPLRLMTVHARTARQMYGGACDRAAFCRIADATDIPLVYNGDIALSETEGFGCRVMVGRGFVKALGQRDGIESLVERYADASLSELSGERPVLGRLKELISYWREMPQWRRRWQSVKISRGLDELIAALRG